MGFSLLRSNLKIKIAKSSKYLSYNLVTYNINFIVLANVYKCRALKVLFIVKVYGLSSDRLYQNIIHLTPLHLII